VERKGRTEDINYTLLFQHRGRGKKITFFITFRKERGEEEPCSMMSLYYSFSKKEKGNDLPLDLVYGMKREREKGKKRGHVGTRLVSSVSSTPKEIGGGRGNPPPKKNKRRAVISISLFTVKEEREKGKKRGYYSFISLRGGEESRFAQWVDSFSPFVASLSIREREKKKEGGSRS